MSTNYTNYTPNTSHERAMYDRLKSYDKTPIVSVTIAMCNYFKPNGFELIGLDQSYAWVELDIDRRYEGDINYRVKMTISKQGITLRNMINEATVTLPLSASVDEVLEALGQIISNGNLQLIESTDHPLKDKVQQAIEEHEGLIVANVRDNDIDLYIPTGNANNLYERMLIKQ